MKISTLCLILMSTSFLSALTFSMLYVFTKVKIVVRKRFHVIALVSALFALFFAFIGMIEIQYKNLWIVVLPVFFGIYVQKTLDKVLAKYKTRLTI